LVFEQIDTMDVFQEHVRKYSWLLCIFFSVDIEGATAYKVNKLNSNEDEDWCLLFESFYVDFPQEFRHNYLSCIEKPTTNDVLQSEQPRLWKFAGDEILFYAPLTNPNQTVEHIAAFRKTLIDYNNILKPHGVQCKGTAWLAGFPINNRIILISNNQESSVIDFVGKSIDTGFRLAKFSTSHRLVVSLDLLWLMSESRKNNIDTKADRYYFLDENIKYAGKHELKGAFSGKPYPIFWIDSYTNPPLENNFLQNQKVCQPSHIIDFCENLSDSMGYSNFAKPFIVGDACGQIKEERINKYFKQRHATLLKYKNQSIPTTKDIDTPSKEGLREVTTDLLLNNITKKKE
jgi:hypothetical protein